MEDEWQSEEESLLDIISDFDADVGSPRGTGPDPISEEASGLGIGNFTLLECLGEGGFGSVWRAEQHHPIPREVAVKIVKPGMDTREVLARFEKERQALALMNHPHIAMVLDAGATAKGRPYFVMELVDGGETITQFSESNHLATKERLTLFLQVCDAIQYAHRKGIIHRDLKPTNILISADSNQAKVIDFGIAKATGKDHSLENSLITRIDQMVGTPAYMSPEQMAGGNDIDTRSDVYSLGVLLYELLTGSPLVSDTDIDTKNLAGWAKVMADRSPPKPSTKITKAREGKFPDLELELELKGDLDCITLKALQPERDHRYGSPGELADDIVRYLNQEPIEARPQSRLYLFKKFALRHRVAVASAFALLLSLVAGLAIASTLLIREREARRIADRETEKSSQVSKILTKTLQSAGASYSLGRDATMMREILETTAEELEETQTLQPEIEAEIRRILGGTFEDLDEYPKAIEQFQRVVEIQRERWNNKGQDNAEPLATALLDMAEGWQSMGRSTLAEQTVKESISLHHRIAWKSEEARQIAKYEAESLLGWTMMRSGQSAEAEEMMREGYEFWLEHPDENRLSEIPKTYGTLLGRIGKREEGEKVMREELRIFQERDGPHHPLIANCLSNLGLLLSGSGKLDEAEILLKESLEQGKILFGDSSPFADHSLSALAGIAAKRGDHKLELDLRRQAVAATENVFTTGHPYRDGTLQSFISALFRQADLETKDGNVDLAQSAVAELEQLTTSHPAAKIDPQRLLALKKALDPAVARED